MSVTTNDIVMRKSLGAYKPNQRLSNLAIAYYEDAEFANRRVFPVCPVALPSGHYYEFDKADLARDNTQIKPPYGTVAPAVFGLSNKSYSCQVHQVLIGLDKLMVLPYQRENGAFDPVKARVKTVTEQINTHQERVFAENFFKTGVWNEEWTGVASSPTGKQFLKFSDSSSDPVPFIDGLATEIKRNGRRRPNKLALGVKTFNALKNNRFILERIKYSGTTQNPAIVNENVLAQIFGLDQVIVCDATYNAAAYGAAANMQYVCDEKGALLLYAPDTPRIDEPSAGYLFSWLLDNGNYIGIQQYEKNDASHTDILEGLISFDMKITGQDLAVYMTNTCD